MAKGFNDALPLSTFHPVDEIKSIDDYNKLSSIYKELPKDPEDIYNGFSNISNELGLFTKKRR